MTSRASSTAQPAALLEASRPTAARIRGRPPSQRPADLPCAADLTTTMDDGLRGRLLGLPLSRLWRPWITWKTCFRRCHQHRVHPLPAHVAPEACRGRDASRDRRCAPAGGQDLAVDSPLLDDAANAHSSAFRQALLARGFVELEGMPLAWVAIDFDSLDGYLGRLSSSRRKNIRRKLRSRDDLQVDCIATGDPALADPRLQVELYALYLGIRAERGCISTSSTCPISSTCWPTARARDGCSVPPPGPADRLEPVLRACRQTGGQAHRPGPIRSRASAQPVRSQLDAQPGVRAAARPESHYVAGWTDSRIKAELGARFTSTRHAIHARPAAARRAAQAGALSAGRTGWRRLNDAVAFSLILT